MYKYNRNKEKNILTGVEIANVNFSEALIQHLKPFEREWILTFIKKIENKNPNWNFNVLYNNLSTLSFKVDDPFNIGGTASYNFVTNTISYCNQLGIFHELLHAATSIETNNRYFCGFEQIKKMGFHSSIGKGLTEGYTNLLEGKYDVTYSWYLMEMDIAKNLNKSVPDMEIYYNSMDLPRLITYLEKYTTRSDTLNFLEMLDYIHKYQYRQNPTARKEIMDLYYECQLYNFRCMISKLLQDIESKSVSVSDAQKHLEFMILFSLSKIVVGRELREVILIEKLKNHIPDLASISENDIKTYKLTLSKR